MAYNLGCEGYICPVMKARKDLVYTALFRTIGGKTKRIRSDEIISVSELDSLLSALNENIIVTGDAAEDFTNEHSNERYSLSPAHLRFQNANGICLAALDHESQSPEEIQASYLQLVKAEKDLIKSERS